MFYQKLIFCILCLDIIKMDQKCVRTDWLSTEYEKGVKEFINFVVKHVDYPNYLNCPCIKCDCLDNIKIEVLRDHLFINGLDTSHTRWIWYGESAREDRPINSSDRRCDERSIVMRVIN